MSAICETGRHCKRQVSIGARCGNGLRLLGFDVRQAAVRPAGRYHDAPEVEEGVAPLRSANSP